MHLPLELRSHPHHQRCNLIPSSRLIDQSLMKDAAVAFNDALCASQQPQPLRLLLLLTELAQDRLLQVSPSHYGPDLLRPCCSCLLPRYVNVPTLKLILAVSSGRLWPDSCHICQLYGCNHLDASLLILCPSTHFNFELARLVFIFYSCERPEIKGYSVLLCLKGSSNAGLFMCNNKLWWPRAQKGPF